MCSIIAYNEIQRLLVILKNYSMVEKVARKHLEYLKKIYVFFLDTKTLGRVSIVMTWWLITALSFSLWAAKER